MEAVNGALTDTDATTRQAAALLAARWNNSQDPTDMLTLLAAFDRRVAAQAALAVVERAMDAAGYRDDVASAVAASIRHWATGGCRLEQLESELATARRYAAAPAGASRLPPDELAARDAARRAFWCALVDLLTDRPLSAARAVAEVSTPEVAARQADVIREAVPGARFERITTDRSCRIKDPPRPAPEAPQGAPTPMAREFTRSAFGPATDPGLAAFDARARTAGPAWFRRVGLAVLDACASLEDTSDRVRQLAAAARSAELDDDAFVTRVRGGIYPRPKMPLTDAYDPTESLLRETVAAATFAALAALARGFRDQASAELRSAVQKTRKMAAGGTEETRGGWRKVRAVLAPEHDLMAVLTGAEPAAPTQSKAEFRYKVPAGTIEPPPKLAGATVDAFEAPAPTTVTASLESSPRFAPTVGAKLDGGKRRFSLLPWDALAKVVDVLEYGARKYAPGNWLAVPGHRDRYFDAAMRHLAAWHAGERLDPESGLPHLAAATCSLLFLLARDDEPAGG